MVSRYLQVSSIEAALVDTRYSILDTRYSILDTRYSILDTRYSISILDPRSSVDTRSSVLDTRYSILDTRYLRTSKIDDDTRYSDRYPILNSAITEDLPDAILERFGSLPCTACDFIFHMDRNVRENFLPSDWSRVVNRATCSVN